MRLGTIRQRQDLADLGRKHALLGETAYRIATAPRLSMTALTTATPYSAPRFRNGAAFR